MAIVFQSDISSFKLSNKNKLKGFIKELLHKEGFSLGTINFRFCDDAEILEVNRNFLNHDYYTDVITFPLNDEGDKIDADILISVDTVLSNSLIQKVRFTQELHRVIIHSILHLCGFGDKTTKEIKMIRKKEDEYLSVYFR